MKCCALIISVITFLSGCSSLAGPGRKSASSWQIAAEKVGAPTTPDSKRCANLMTKVAFPIYPQYLRDRGVEGWVVVAFELDGSGKPSNTRVLHSKPERAFDRAAVEALEKTHFKEGAVKEDCESVSTFVIYGE